MVTTVLLGCLLQISSSYKPGWFYNWHGIRSEIRDSVRLIEQSGIVTSGTVGYLGKTPQQWYRRKWVMKNASEEELSLLLTYPNGAVRVTAYEGLLRKGGTNEFEIFSRALSDTVTYFNFQTGCEGRRMMIGEYLVQNLIPVSDKVPLPPPNSRIDYDLTKVEILNLQLLYNDLINRKNKGEN